MIIQDSGFRVDVAQECIERGDALRETALDTIPLLGGDEARHKIIREDLFCAFLLSVNSEGDALRQERELG